MKKYMYIILVLIMAFYIMGCKKNTSENDNSKALADNSIAHITSAPKTDTVEQVQPTVTIAPTENESHEGEMRSYLSGQWVPIEVGTKRPIAFQFNNFKTVSNQSGISQADILYECIVEGGITRLLGISEHFTGDRIGSTRSARHYFVSIADEYNAIYIHYGKTKYATSKMKELAIDHIDGSEALGSVVFYRDKSIKAPHNAFASIDGINAGIKKKGFETKYQEGYEPHFTFFENDTDLTGTNDANKVSLNFSGYNAPYFVYDSKDRTYDRFQFGKEHIDMVIGEQLKFKNIIIQFVKEWNIDKNGYQTMDLANASGRGYYITNGKVVLITWKKNEAKSWMRYYNDAGEELTINPGKTYIALFPQDRTEDVTIK